MKALVVTYLPGGVMSNTKKLADHAIDILKKRRVQLELLDLTKDVPDLFSPERIAIYYERNYGGKTVSAEKTALMAKMDRMADQLKAADRLVLAYPMHNFSMPATVKAWFDAVMLKGETWDITANGYVGLLKDRKALVLSTSGGVYEGELSFLEHSASLAKTELGFMGMQPEVVVASGINKFPDKVPQTIAAANSRITEILNKWLA
jgi:FMN-dependent NADH-azoreductase